MRLKKLCALAVVVWAAWGSDVRADDAAPEGSWLGRWFRFGRATDPKNLYPISGPTAPLVLDPHAQARADYFRRSAACAQLQKIALETRDDDLYRQAELLTDEIWQHFQRETAGPSR